MKSDLIAAQTLSVHVRCPSLYVYVTSFKIAISIVTVIKDMNHEISTKHLTCPWRSCCLFASQSNMTPTCAHTNNATWREQKYS